MPEESTDESQNRNGEHLLHIPLHDTLVTEAKFGITWSLWSDFWWQEWTCVTLAFNYFSHYRGANV